MYNITVESPNVHNYILREINLAILYVTTNLAMDWIKAVK